MTFSRNKSSSADRDGEGPGDAFTAGASAFSAAARDSAQQIWLAGLGAFAKAQAEGSKVFDALVKEGAQAQRQTHSQAGERLAEATQRMSEFASSLGSKASAPWERLEGIFEERVAKALERLGMPSAARVEALEARIAALEAQLHAQDRPARSRATASARAASPQPRTARPTSRTRKPSPPAQG